MNLAFEQICDLQRQIKELERQLQEAQRYGDTWSTAWSEVCELHTTLKREMIEAKLMIESLERLLKWRALKPEPFLFNNFALTAASLDHAYDGCMQRSAYENTTEAVSFREGANWALKQFNAQDKTSR